MFKAITNFKDLRDGGYEYRAGDEFPRKGLAVDDKRLAQLSSPTTMRGPLIEEVAEKPKRKKKGEDA